MIASQLRSSKSTAIGHAVTGGCRRHISAVVGAVYKGDVVFIEAEWAAHEAVKTEHIANQLDHARKFSTTHALSSARYKSINCYCFPHASRTKRIRVQCSYHSQHKRRSPGGHGLGAIKLQPNPSGTLPYLKYTQHQCPTPQNHLYHNNL